VTEEAWFFLAWKSDPCNSKSSSDFKTACVFNTLTSHKKINLNLQNIEVAETI
jgi:hypothetical protein